MRALAAVLSLLVGILAVPATAAEQMRSMSVTVSYRERIALPPGAQLDLRLLEAVNAGEHSPVMASQRFAMSSVPMTVSLAYDPQVIDGMSGYAIFAAIRAPDGKQMFRAIKKLGIMNGSDQPAIDIMLTMSPEADMNAAVPRRITGVAWTVTEVFGEAWPNSDPATLAIDDHMNVSAFGGCNRFRGQVQPSGPWLTFSENMAGTMMACPDDIEAWERRFLAALTRVVDYVRYGAGLVMTDAEGSAVLHFLETPE